jgi:hypothetical protein
MQAHQQTALGLLENQVFAMVARLHVILRRENQRITDIEYMRVSPTYCHHVLELAAQSPNLDLQQLAEKLEGLYFGRGGIFSLSAEKPPLVKNRVSTVQLDMPQLMSVNEEAPPAHPSFSVNSSQIAKEPEVAYVGRLR